MIRVLNFPARQSQLSPSTTPWTQSDVHGFLGCPRHPLSLSQNGTERHRLVEGVVGEDRKRGKERDVSYGSETLAVETLETVATGVDEDFWELRGYGWTRVEEVKPTCGDVWSEHVSLPV